MTQSLPEVGAIGTCRTYGSWLDRLCSAVIRWGTATKVKGVYVDAKVNHAVVYVGKVEGYDKPQLVQAQPGGADFADWDSYNDMVWDSSPQQRLSDGELAPLPLDVAQRNSIASYAVDCAIKEIGYNYIDLVAVALAQRRLHTLINPSKLSWWNKAIVERLSRPDRLICSQLVDYCYEKAGVRLFDDNRPSGLVSPNDLYQLGGAL